MKLRLYSGVEPLYSFTDKRDGKTFGSLIHGENTHVSFMDRLQGSRKTNCKNYEQIVFSIQFLDLDCGMTLGAKTLWPEDKLYVDYGQAMMEQDSLEEYYKLALFLAKRRLVGLTTQWPITYAKYLNGEHVWPINKSNIKNYIASNKLDIKILKSIDIEESGLKYIESFKLQEV